MKNTGSALLRSKATEGQAKIWVIVIALAVVGGVGYVVWKNGKVGVPVTPAQEVAVGKDETASWKTYRNDKYRLSLKYPADLTLVGFDNLREGNEETHLFNYVVEVEGEGEHPTKIRNFDIYFFPDKIQKPAEWMKSSNGSPRTLVLGENKYEVADLGTSDSNRYRERGYFLETPTRDGFIHFNLRSNFDSRLRDDSRFLDFDGQTKLIEQILATAKFF